MLKLRECSYHFLSYYGQTYLKSSAFSDDGWWTLSERPSWLPSAVMAPVMNFFMGFYTSPHIFSPWGCFWVALAFCRLTSVCLFSDAFTLLSSARAPGTSSAARTGAWHAVSSVTHCKSVAMAIQTQMGAASPRLGKDTSRMAGPSWCGQT